MFKLSDNAVELIENVVKYQYIDEVRDTITNSHLMIFVVPAEKSEYDISITINLTEDDFERVFDPYQWNRVTDETVNKLDEYAINSDYNSNVYLIKDDENQYNVITTLDELDSYDWDKISIKKISVKMIRDTFAD